MPETEPALKENLNKYLDLAVRRRWWILLPACFVCLATSVVLVWLPNHYTSEGTLLVVQQQVPERYVTPTTSSGLAEALQAMKEEVLSRTRLFEIIDEFHLYQKERKRLAPEQVIDLMRRNIGIQPLNTQTEQRDFNAFKISFTADNPHLAQEVTSKLTSLFIEENLKTREDQATNTTNFLSQQLSDVEKRLSDQEQRLRDYKMKHLGELPEQEQGNLAVLSGLQTQLQSTEASLGRAQQQRVYLQSLLNSYRNLAKGGAAPEILSGMRLATPLQTAQTELTRLQSARDDLVARYTPQHPDVRKAEADIARQRQFIEKLRSAKAPETDQGKISPTASTNADDDDVSVLQIRSQLEANRLEIEGLSKDEQRIKTAAAGYESRLESTPITEQQLAGVLRDYDLLKKEYADLLNKQQQSQLAASLEKEQEGQQFRLVDPPSLPTVPSSPKRMKISLGGLAGGIVLALALAILMEMNNPSFHTEKELNLRFGLPLVLGVPLLPTPAEMRKRFWIRIAESIAASALLLVVFGAEFYVYRIG